MFTRSFGGCRYKLHQKKQDNGDENSIVLPDKVTIP